jgi:hypothetical protein
MSDKAVLRLEEKRARIPDRELAYYETIITAALDIIYALKPVVHRVSVDDLDLVLQAMMSAKFIRDRFQSRGRDSSFGNTDRMSGGG